MSKKLNELTQKLVHAARTNPHASLKLEGQLALFGDEAAQLGTLPIEARVKLLRHVDPELVNESTPEELAPVYDLGKKKGRLTEERYASAVTPEVQAGFPYDRVLAWLAGGSWTQESTEGANKLRAAILTVVLDHLESFSVEQRIEARAVLVSIVAPALIDDAKKDKVVAILFETWKGAKKDELVFKHFSPLEIASCAKGVWGFLSTMLDAFAQPASEDDASASVPTSSTETPATPAS